jgi:hypothetical protein
VTSRHLGAGVFSGTSAEPAEPPACAPNAGVAITRSIIVTFDRLGTFLANESGVLCASGPLSRQFNGTFSVDGGSGCFENARGGGDVTATETLAASPGSVESRVSRTTGSVTADTQAGCALPTSS